MRPDWTWDQAIDWFGFAGTLMSFAAGFLACLVFGVPN